MNTCQTKKSSPQTPHAESLSRNYIYCFLRGEFKSLQDCVIVLDRERLYAIRYQNSATGEKTVLLAMAKAISGPHVAVLPSHGFWTSDLHSWTKTSTDNFPPKSDILHVMAFPGDGTAFYDSLSRRNF